jgi:hypothetical protein
LKQVPVAASVSIEADPVPNKKPASPADDRHRTVMGQQFDGDHVTEIVRFSGRS